MNPMIPVWILGAPFLGLLTLSFLFKGQSAMGGPAPRLVRRRHDGAHVDINDTSTPLTAPMHADAPRRIV